jgi:hypothetical protein
LPKLLKTKAEMQQIATLKEANTNNLGYLKLLNSAENLGVLSNPNFLSAIHILPILKF